MSKPKQEAVIWQTIFPKERILLMRKFLLGMVLVCVYPSLLL